MPVADVKTMVRFLEAAKRDRNGRFRERLCLSPGRYITCQSKGELKEWRDFVEALQKGHLKPSQFSIRDIFEATVKDGREMIESWNPRFGPDGGASLVEAAGAIQSSDFSNITGQIVYTRMIEAMTPEQFPFQQLIPTQQTPYDGEKIPGIAGLGDVAQVVAEGRDFPLVQTGEDWIETAPGKKRGLIVPITKEALFFDRTGRLLQEAGAVGEALMLNKEKRAIDCVIDENTTDHRYKWRGTTYATYQTTTPWDNVTASNALVDWSDIDNANQTFNAIVDPNTGEPVIVEATTLICTKQREMAALRIRNASEVTVVTPGYATTANPSETRQANPVGGAFEVVSSRQLAARLATDTDWFYGDPRKAFVYMENWGLTVVQAPPNNSDDFNKDIVVKFKGSERGQYNTLNPRFMQKSTE